MQSPTPPTVSAPIPALSRRFVAGWAILAGAVMFALGVFRNDFPYAYHPDEPSKVEQLVYGTRNYHHPPLMLTLADAASRAFGVTREPDRLARVGRTLSAAYLAGAVALLTVLAGVYGRTRGAVVTAAGALCIDAQAVLAAHFFKEDALFMFALALTFVAGAAHWRRRGKLDALALGAAAGLTVSSKYLGALAVVYALWLIALARAGWGRKMWVAFGWCGLGILAAVVLCNGPALWGHFDEIREGWRLGVSTVQEGNGGVGATVPNLQFVGMLFVLTPASVLLGAAVFWVDLRKYPFRLYADRWLAGLSPLCLTAVFSFSASTAVRYFLPVSLMLGCAAGVALPGVVGWVAGRIGAREVFSIPSARTMMAMGLVWTFSLPMVVPLLLGFAGDDRAELTRWIADHLPPDSIIAQDDLARLPVAGASEKLASARFAFIEASSAADLGSLQQMREGSVDYVVVCWYDSRRYVDPRKHPGPDARDFLQRREFYGGLQTHARSLWKSELGQPFPLRPGLELFALDPP